MKNKAYKFRIYPNKTQCELIEKTFSYVRFIYNKMLADKIEYYNKNHKKLKNTPAQYKKEFEWLKEVDSLALANAQMNLQAAFENFFRNVGNGFPKFKSKKHSKNRYTTNFVNGNIFIKDGMIKLPKLGFVKMRQHRAIPDGYTLKSVTVSRNAAGSYFVSILFEYEDETERIDPETLINLSYCEDGLYIDGTGFCMEYPESIIETAQRLKKAQRRVSKMKKGSNNRKKQRLRAARLHERLANQRRDFLHKESRQIANACDCVCVREPAGSINDIAWGMFTTFLQYKMADAGKSFIKSDARCTALMKEH